MVGDSPGPYEREIRSQLLPLAIGEIDLRCGNRRVTATVRGGDVEIALVEKIDAVITAYELTKPVRRLGHRQVLRLVVEADLDRMTVVVGEDPGNG